MADAYVNLDHSSDVSLHDGWLEHKSSHDTKWKNVWLLLQRNTLYLYNTQNYTQETPICTLSLHRSTFKFEKKDGSEKTGYKFDVIIDRNVYKFKATKFSEREQWKAFLEGVATGEVSDKIDLPSDYLDQIRLTLKYIKESSDSISVIQYQSDGDDNAHSSTSGSFHLADLIENEDLDRDSGCVIPDFYLEPVVLKPSNLQGFAFHTDPLKTDVPSWFFQNCPRELAMEILDKGDQYGNTLMRKGTMNKTNLVISKKMEFGKENFTHYEVVDHPDGYKLNVENPHQPMKNVAAVMDFFVQTSGVHTTRPMTCNNLVKIGILPDPDHDYKSCIIKSPVPSTPNLPPPTNKIHQSYMNVGTQHHAGSAQSTLNLPTSSNKIHPSYMNVGTQNHAGLWNQKRSQSIPDMSRTIMQMRERRKMSEGIITMEATKVTQPTASKPTMNQVPESFDVPPSPPSSSPPPLPNHRNKRLIQPPQEIRPELPPNHPPPLHKKNQQNPGIPNIISPGQSALVAPKDPRETERNSTHGRKIGDSFQDGEFKKDESDKVIYAVIRKKKPLLHTSFSVPLPYENLELPGKRKVSVNSSCRLSSSTDAKINYIELRTKAMMTKDFKQQTYEPINLSVVDERMSSSCYDHQRDKRKDEQKNSSYETYELSESIFEDSLNDSSLKNHGLISTRKDSFHDNTYAEEYTNCDLLDYNDILSTENYELVSKTYEPVNETTDSRNFQLKEIIKALPGSHKTGGNNEKRTDKRQEEENVYEVIHINTKKTSKPTDVKKVNGISSPGEIYGGAELNHIINRPKIPLPKPRRRTNSLTLKTEKPQNSTKKKANTLNALDSLRSELWCSDEKHYDEVLQNAMPQRCQAKCAANYIDVIVNYEDIKAAQISQKILSGSKNHVLAEDFKKKLEEMWDSADKAQTVHAIKHGKSILSTKPSAASVFTAPTKEETFNSSAPYQNVPNVPVKQRSVYNN